MSYPELKMLIDGEWTAGTAGKSEPVICPADGMEIGQVPHASPPILTAPLIAVLSGLNQWRVMTPLSRQAILEKCSANS